MNRQKIILDVDTGHDDAVAIMLAAGNPAVELAGITVVAGNQVLEKTLKNTLNLCDALHIGAPVYAGMQRPLLRGQITGSHIHGESGFDGPVFTSCSKKAAEGHAVRFIIDTVLAYPGEIVLVPTGPLTNIAAAVRMEPAIVPKIRNIVLMGGSAGAGNVTPSAEFNIYADAEAADIVFSCGARIVMMGLDVTRQVVLTPGRLEKLRAVGTRAAEIFGASMDCYMKACMAYTGESPAMHDPCCVAYVIEPEMFTVCGYNVQIETYGRHTYGRTVVDTSGVSHMEPNALVATGVREQRFLELLADAFESYA